MTTKTLYNCDHLSELYVHISRDVTYDNAITYDLHITHSNSISESVVITVTSTSCVLDVLKMALTLYKLENLIDEDREQAMIKGVRKALGYKS